MLSGDHDSATENQPEKGEAVGNDLIDSLSAEDRRAALDELEEVRLEDGVTIVSPEGIQSSVYFPVDSVISEYQILQDGKTIEVAMTGGEGVSGIHTVFAPQPSPHFAEVLVPGSALRADPERFRRLIRSDAGLREVLFDFQNIHTAQISQRVICSNYHTSEERLCLWLMMIHDRTGATELAFTQEQISRFLGVYRPSVTVALQSLGDGGLIRQERGMVIIRDLEKVERSACGCYAELGIDRRLN